MKRFGSIYKITNKTNGKAYIGQTVMACEIRWNAHVKEYKKSAIHHALSKYGKDSFLFEEVYTSFSKEDLNSAEIYFINLFDTMKNGYNLTKGGDKVYLSEETRQQMAKNQTGKSHTNRKPIKMINIETEEVTILSGAVEAKKYGLDPSLVRSCLSGMRPTHKGFRFERINQVNQSGSAENKSSEHAQRLGSEAATAEYNLPTSPRGLSKYQILKEEIISLYHKTNSSYKVAETLDLDKKTVCKWLKTWGELRTQSQAASKRNINRYSKIVR